MNLLDSSAWLDILDGGKNSAIFAEVAEDVENLIVPTLCLLEVPRVFLRRKNERGALEAYARMRRGHLVGLDEELALEAARLSVKHGLALADSVVFAAASQRRALLWTQDADFKGLPGVRYFPAQKG